jgi:UDP-N-acetylglucosamine acyltransferase
VAHDVSSIHPSAVVGPGVELGDDVVVGPFAVLTGPMRVGNRVWVGTGAVLGAPPEVTTARMNSAWDGDLAHEGVEIGDDVVIREHAVVHQGALRPTRVGARTWLLSRSYVAHDVEIGTDVVLSAGTSVGGHVTIGRGANLGLNVAVHQRRVIGPGAMVGMSTAVTRDVPPFALVHGSPLRVHGVNAYALRRDGIDETVIEALRSLYLSGVRLTTLGAVGELEAIATELEWWNERDGLQPARAQASAGGW